MKEKIPRSSFDIPVDLYKACKKLVSDNFQADLEPKNLKTLYILALEEYIKNNSK